MPKYQSALLKSASHSPYSSSSKTKSAAGSRSVPSKRKRLADDDDNHDPTVKLPDIGLFHALATSLQFRDVPQMLRYINSRTFSKIPERSGFNSVRIAEILNFRRNLPPVVSLAHLLALSKSPTQAERETDELVRKGIVRRLAIPGRGGTRGNAEFLVIVEDWLERARDSELEDELKEKYITALNSNAASAAVPSSTFTPSEAHALIRAGFLTGGYNPNVSRSAMSPFLNPDSSTTGTLASLASAGSRAAAGSVAAVGGECAFLDAGGGGGALTKSDADETGQNKTYGTQYAFTLPSLGLYLKLLESSRSHLTKLLEKTRFQESPRDLLHERWDAGLASGEKERKRGLREVALPSKTKKWRQLWGVRFDWVLEECIGAGLVEAFETGSVGVGLRLL